MDSIHSLIAAADGGDSTAREALFVALYAELRQLARRELARRGQHAGIGATSLLHEAYLAIVVRSGTTFPDRARFMAYAARVMRGLIIDHARERQAVKRGGGFEITTLDADVSAEPVDYEELASISAALDELGQTDPTLAEVVDLRFFCGFSVPEVAAILSTSERSVYRSWEKARLYLHQYLRPQARPEQ